jgi:hypothetical protein
VVVVGVVVIVGVVGVVVVVAVVLVVVELLVVVIVVYFIFSDNYKKIATCFIKYTNKIEHVNVPLLI